MSTTLDLPEDLVEDIQLRAAREGRGVEETAAELLRAGLAASPMRPTEVVVEPARLEERKRIAAKFLSGEWGVELAGAEEGRASDRNTAEGRDRVWRG
jgi:plasmid stability protein